MGALHPASATSQPAEWSLEALRRLVIMRQSFSFIDKQFLRRIVWLLILALFSVLIFWQQTRADVVNPGMSGMEWGAFVVEAGVNQSIS
jgi:hypothetical protein